MLAAKGRNVPAFFVKSQWKAKDGAGSREGIFKETSICTLKAAFMRCVCEKGRYANPGRKNLKEAIMIDFKVDASPRAFPVRVGVKDCLRPGSPHGHVPWWDIDGDQVRCQHCLVVCSHGVASIMGLSVLIASLVAISRKPRHGTGYVVQGTPPRLAP